MRALLIVNPHATATTERRRVLLTRALAGAMDVTVAETTHRGHATALARRAAEQDTDVVIVHGGDGTVNEVVNGLLADGVDPSLPMLAVVPGGSTNVFARAVGIDADPTAATEQILDSIPRCRSRTVSVGRAGDRYFTFNAGLGFDADVVRAVEEYRATGREISNALHVRRAVRAFFAGDRRHPALTVTVDGTTVTDVFVALISNVDPWSYAGRRAVHTNPTLAGETDLGVLALKTMRIATVLRIFRQLLWARSGPRSTALWRVDRASEVVVRSAEPQALQVDGDYLGQASEVVFRSVPRALRVVV